MRLPIDVSDLIKSGSQLQEEREKPVRVAVFVEIDAPDSLIEAVQERFRPYTAGAYVQVEVVEPDTQFRVDPSTDAVIGVSGEAGEAFAEVLREARERAIPTALLVLAEEPAAVAETLEHPLRDTLGGLDPSQIVADELGEWLVERIPGKRLAFAHNFIFMRRAVAVEHVRNTAFQNALIGAVVVIPGADMPLMTANQSKMILQIAAAYGERLGMERARELLGVVGGGLAFRTVARQAVAFVPGFGWAVKGGIGYSGTIAMGYAAIAYFDSGGDLGNLKERLEEYGTQVAARLRTMTRRELREAARDEDVRGDA